MAQIKRERSPSPVPPAAPSTASSAIKSAISHLLQSEGVPPLVSAHLLVKLSDASVLAAEQEKREDERDRKRVKREEDPEQKEGQAQTDEGDKAEGEKEDEPVRPLLPRWSPGNTQGDLDEVEKGILREVEAALPLLDKLVRPFFLPSKFFALTKLSYRESSSVRCGKRASST